MEVMGDLDRSFHGSRAEAVLSRVKKEGSRRGGKGDTEPKKGHLLSRKREKKEVSALGWGEDERSHLTLSSIF